MSMKTWDFPFRATIPAGRRTVTVTPRYKCDELIGASQRLRDWDWMAVGSGGEVVGGIAPDLKFAEGCVLHHTGRIVLVLPGFLGFGAPQTALLA